MRGKVLILASVIVSAALSVEAQSTFDSARRNVIKLDITSHWLYRKAIVLTYERIVKNHPNQSWSITAGYQQFPNLSSAAFDSVTLKKELNASGFKVGGEYRFYLMKENKFPAPHGVYIGPYSTYHHYSNGRSLEVDNNGTLEDATVKSKLDIFNLGVQLGYQFVLNNRWTIDLSFMGPSLSYYRANVKIDGNYTFNPDDISNEILDAMIEQFPGFKELIDKGEFNSNGKIDTWSYGYRYQLLIGYHFGRKK
jgi:hypothetical protein